MKLDEIINLDKLTYCGNLGNLKDIEKNPRYKFVKGDICNSQSVNRVVKDCDVIVNMAAETHVDRSILGSSAFIKTNIYGTHTILEAAKKYKIGKMIQISTDETYGSIKKGSFKESDSLEKVKDFLQLVSHEPQVERKSLKFDL